MTSASIEAAIGDAESRMRAALARAAASGWAPVALYGAGAHADRVRAALREPPVELLGFVDDDPVRQGRALLGMPVMSREEALLRGVRCVVLNSDSCEPVMWRRREEFESRGVRVLRLYGDGDRGESAPVADEVTRVEAAMSRPEHLARSAVQTYWATRGSQRANDENHPLAYRKNLGWSLLLAEWLEEARLPQAAPILELGCNIGRNLALLRRRGFTSLAAIEINGHALETMRRLHPETAQRARLIHAPLEQALPNLADGEFDLVYSMAVLEHVHTDSDFIFEHVVRVTRRFVLTVEDEVGNGPRHFRRNYERVFTALGMRQARSLAFAEAPPETAALLELEPPVVMRLFERA